MEKINQENIIYLAGGCFWGLEHLMHTLKGVTNATSGYANGNQSENVTYKLVCTGKTGFRETVKVEYDPEIISLDAILLTYFHVINPTITNRQGNDIGTQYQTGIYYTNVMTQAVVERIVKLEKERYPKFCVEVGPLKNFYPAEEYHQRYLDKNPNGYCHIPTKEIALFKDTRIDPGHYQKPDQATLKASLSEEAYQVTQNAKTEKPFQNAFCNTIEKGIYVDIVTGEPLFSSLDKYTSSCGWPAFSKPIEKPTVVELEDLSIGMVRTEVRSRSGNSHLGHVFYNDSESPNGVHYCINSAALKFIPYEQMDAAGYGYLKVIFDNH